LVIETSGLAPAEDASLLRHEKEASTDAGILLMVNSVGYPHVPCGTVGYLAENGRRSIRSGR